MTIRAKVVSLTVLLVLFSLCVSGGFFFATYYNSLLMNTYHNLNTAITHVQSVLMANFDALNNMAYHIFSNEYIRMWTQNEISFPLDDPMSFSNLSKLRKDVQMILIFNNSWTSKHISAIHLFVDERDFEIIGRSYVPMEVFARAKARADAVEGFTFFLEPDNIDGDVYFVKRIHNITGSKVLTIICAISQDAFTKTLSMFDEDVEAHVTGASGIICFSNRPEMVGSRSQFDPEPYVPVDDIRNAYRVQGPEGDQFVVSRNISAGDLNIVISQPHSQIIQRTLRSMGNYIWVMGTTLMFLTILSFLAAAAYTRFIKNIIDSLNQVREKDYSVRMPHYQDSQLNLISDTFNSMADEIETLINKVYKSSLLLRESDIRLLQSQMNPHFLVNALTTIGTSALMRGDAQTHESITALCGLLAANLHSLTDSGFVTVKSELRYVQLYLYLQHMRFADRLQYHIALHESWLEECYIPRLSLEPIVENAVVHGLGVSERMGCVSVDILREQDNLVFVVTDNGVGFDPDTLSKSVSRSGSGHNIGLYNTDKRLKYIFGDEYGIQIKSVCGQGTTVRISMPVVTTPTDSRIRGDEHLSGIDR